VSIDITERKQSEEHVKLLMREINHRAKNLLSVVQVMASEVEPREFAGRFAQPPCGFGCEPRPARQVRLAGGRHCRSCLFATGALWGVIGVRVFLDGPILELKPSAAQTIGIALHAPGAPWVVRAADLASFGGNANAWRPLTPNGSQQTFDFQ
jgi:hypothetical protein